MKKTAARIYNKFVRRTFTNIRIIVNKKGHAKKCNVCNKTFSHYLKYKNGIKDISPFQLRLNIIGSDVENFYCPHCLSFDRERHLFLYFDRLGLWQKIKNYNILHIAPEKNMAARILSVQPLKYVRGDLFPSTSEIQKMDVTKLPFDSDSFDMVLCNHILEHVKDFKLALSEIHRVLKKDGIAILQTPYSKLLSANFEEAFINTDELRNFFYGETSHLRVFSEKEFFNDIINVGFSLNIVKHDSFFNSIETLINGINREEDLIMVIKRQL